MAEFCGLVEDMNQQPFTSGPYQGRSGMDVLAEKAAAGWRPTWASPLAIDAAFCERTQLAISAERSASTASATRIPACPQWSPPR